MDQENMDVDLLNDEIELHLDNIKNFKLCTRELSQLIVSASPPNGSILNLRLSRILKATASFLKKNVHEIAASNSKVIEECSDCVQNALLCIPPNQLMEEVDHAYFCLLNALAEVNFPVTSIVNHVMVVALRQSCDITAFFNDITSPDDTTKLKFFLKHAHDPQDGFSLKGFRLSDFLLTNFFQQECPRALLEILRYGCSDLLKKKCFDMERHNFREVGTVIISEYKLLDTLQFFLSFVSYNGPSTEQELQAKADCLKVIFRSVYMFSFEQLYALSDVPEYTNGLKSFKDFGMNFLNKANRFPELDERLGKTPPSLKHVCRFEIRKILYQNWALPDGIKALGLPFMVQEFLDLKVD